MQTALAGTALLMGLAGGPHCVAMCGAACAGVVRLVRPPTGGGVATWAPGAAGGSAATVALHAGRLLGYAAGGAVAAATVQSLGAASAHVAALRPLWVLLHVFVFGWGAVLAIMGRQPLWAHQVGRRVAGWLRPLSGSLRGVFAAGVLWLAMPCGLLYSALMVAALAGSVAGGMAVMAVFAIGSGVSLWAGPWLLLRLGSNGRGAWSMRIAGLALMAVSAWGLYMGLVHDQAPWCVVP